MEGDLSSPLLSFTLDLCAEVRRGIEAANIFFSPFSIATALGMTLAGARGSTAEEILAALHTKEVSSFHRHFLRLQESLQKHMPDVTVHVANRMYCAKDFQPLEAYCALLQEVYGSTVMSTDFGSDSEAVRRQINAWVEEATRNRIKDLLPRGLLTDLTVAILVNAVYFKGLWAQPFTRDRTEQMKFHETLAVTANVDMMFRKGRFKIGHSDDLNVTAVELPYANGFASMIVLLPDEIEGLDLLHKSLNSHSMRKLLVEMKLRDSVHVYFPKFRLEETIDLKTVLCRLGVQKIFSSSADLSGISTVSGFQLSDAVHKAFVEVDEEGTEAAAATALVRVKKCAVQEVQRTTFKADHPFTFFILENDSKVVLFMGSLSKVLKQ